jgi:hypothetical protein
MCNKSDVILCDAYHLFNCYTKYRYIHGTHQFIRLELFVALYWCSSLYRFWLLSSVGEPSVRTAEWMNEWRKEGRKEGRVRRQVCPLLFHSFQQSSGKCLAPSFHFTHYRGQKRWCHLYEGNPKMRRREPKCSKQEMRHIHILRTCIHSQNFL